MKNAPAKKGGARAPTYSVKIGHNTKATTPDLALAKDIASEWLRDYRSVTIYSNADRKAVAHYIYGHRQHQDGETDQ